MFSACPFVIRLSIKSSLVCVATRGSFMVRLAQRCCFEQARDSREQFIGRHGLSKVNLETCHQRARAVLRLRVPRERYRGHALGEARAAPRLELAHLSQHRVSVRVGKTDVAEQ